jgi:hypothetical protein
LIALGLAAVGGAGTAGAQGPRPYDPLTPAEREVAVRLAKADTRVLQIAGGRAFDVAYAELLVPKLAGAPRQAEVLISVFEAGFTGIRAVVDLNRLAVVQVALVERGVIVPFSPREVELARTVALRSTSVRALAGAAQSGYAIDYLPITSPEPELCPSGRCLELLFRHGNSYSTSTAVVEIPTQAVHIRRGPR